MWGTSQFRIARSAVLAAAVFPSALAAAPPQDFGDEACRHDGWRLLGRIAPGKEEPRVLDASGFRGFSQALRFKAEGDTASFRSIRVFTGPRAPVVIPLQRLKAGEISRSFPMPSDASVIRRIEIVARSDGDNARVAVCVRLD